MADHYEDQTNGGFFMTADDHENMIAREKPGYDGALPSGNAVAVMNLLRLAAFTTDDRFRQRAAKTLAAFSASLRSNPLGLSEMMLALDFFLDEPKEIIIATPKNNDAEHESFLETFRSVYLPNRVLAQIAKGPPADRLAAIMPMIPNDATLKGRAVAYVCTQGVCQLPSLTVEDFEQQLRTVQTL
jgi:hypothetical protein